jgi:signal transduction histidine kinase
MKLFWSYKLFYIILSTLLGCCFVAQSFAATPKTQSIQKDIDELKTFIESGLQYIKDNGETKAYQEFNNPKGKFRNGNLYLFVIGFDGKVLAEGGNPKDFVGKKLSGAKDKFGTPYFQLFVEAVKRGGGVVSYYWPRPDNGALQYKSSYIAPLNKKAFIGAGVYKSLEVVVSPETKIKKLKKYIDSASEYVKQKGAQEAYKEFNNKQGKFTNGDLYIFIVNYKGKVLAHGGDPKKFVDKNISTLRDEFDTPMLMMFVEAAKSGGGLVSYYWPNYTKGGATLFKTSYIEPLDDKTFIGAGYYED